MANPELLDVVGNSSSFQQEPGEIVPQYTGDGRTSGLIEKLTREMMNMDQQSRLHFEYTPTSKKCQGFQIIMLLRAFHSHLM